MIPRLEYPLLDSGDSAMQIPVPPSFPWPVTSEVPQCEWLLAPMTPAGVYTAFGTRPDISHCLALGAHCGTEAELEHALTGVQEGRISGIRMGWLPASVLQRMAGHDNLTHLDVWSAAVSEADLTMLGGIPSIRHLALGGHGAGKCIPAAAFGKLEVLPELHSLRLPYNSRGNRGKRMGDLANLKSLRHLEVQHCSAFKDEDLARLAKVEQLSSLDLDACTAIRGNGFRDVPRLAWLNLSGGKRFHELEALSHLGLRHLFLVNCPQVSEGQLPTLAELVDLQTLDLSGCGPIGDTGAAAIAKLSKLRHLDLGMGVMTDDGLARLAAIKDLRWLYVRSKALTDAGVEALSSLRQLRRLFVGSPQLTERASAALTAALPQCEVRVDSGKHLCRDVRWR